MSWLSKRLAWVLMLASGSLFFQPLASRALWNSDEGRYAEIAREMLELRDWITPHLNYVLYFEKPPLVYWLTAVSFAVFGPTEFAARFWSALFGLATVGLVYVFGKHWKNEETGLFAGSILATSVLFFALTQYLVVDMALTFWLTLALYALSRMVTERPPERVRRFSYLLALAMAGAFLTKGLIGVLFPIGSLFLVALYCRLFGQLKKVPWKGVLIVTALLAAPWFVLISLRHPSFFYYFFVREHFARFLTSMHHREAPLYFFIPVIFGGFLPWTLFLPKIFTSAFQNRGTAMKRDPVKGLLVIWTFFVFFFFSASQSKLVAYMLPVFPALALLTGEAFGEAYEAPEIPAWLNGGLISLIWISIGSLVALKIPWVVDHLPPLALMTIHTHGDSLGLILAVVVFLLVGVWGMRHPVATFGGIMMSQVLLLSALVPIAASLDPYFSNKGLARIISQRAQPQDRVVSYGISFENVLQSLPFYAKRRVAVFGDPGELSMGAEDAPDAADWFSSETTALQSVKALPPGSWVVTNEEYLKGLRDAGIADELEQVSREGRLLLLHKVQ